jgi:hypothetical protein
MRNAAADQTLWEVTLKSGRKVQGTEQELNSKFPDANWKRVAQPVQRAQATRSTTAASQITALVEQDMDFADDSRPGRLPNSSRTYAPVPGRKRVEYEYQDEIVHTSIPPRRSATQQRGKPNRATPPDTIYGQAPVSRYTDEPQPKQQKRGFFHLIHPLVWVGLGMFVMLGAWIGLLDLGAWWQVHNDDVQYGRPRTAQYNVVAGHDDSPQHPTHIIAMNLNRRVLIIELPGGDASKSRIYKGSTLFGPDADLAPVTLTFSDPEHTGRPEMIVLVRDTTLIYQNVKIGGVWQFAPPQSQ